MKGAQVSLEYMLVMALSLSVLLVWLGGVGQVNEAMGKALRVHAQRLAAERLRGSINSVCLAGPGNEQQLSVFFPGNTSITYGEELGVNNFTRKVHCEVLVELPSQLRGSYSLRVTNQEGRVVLSTQE